MESSSNPPQRLRRLLATLAVAAACAAVVAVVLATLGGSGPEPANAGAPEPAPVAEGTHGGSVPGMSESELVDLETRTLGPEHASEHAQMREAMREQPAADDQPEPQRQVAAAAAAEEAGVPGDVGQWIAEKYKMPIVAIHAALLPTGKVMIFSYPTYPNRPNSAQAWLWNPATPAAPPVAKNPPGLANIWCAGQTFAENGELVVFGGNLDYESPSQTWKGLDQVFTFNPWTETWKEQPKMAHGRWYPTGVRMPDGRIPIVGGLDETGLLDPNSHTNFEVELFTPSPALSGVGQTEKIGDGEWWADNEPMQDPVKPPIKELYPRMISMASGSTLLAGPDRDSSWFIDDVDANPFSWHDAPNLTRHRTWGTAVPLPSGPEGPTQVLALGGTQYSNEPSSATTELFDEDSPGSGWRAQSNNVYGRGHANTVLLPDGSMVEVGGGRGSSAGEVANFPSPLHYAKPETKAIELWDPQTKQWRLGPEQTESRAYHSTALLLPDGRVMSAGDEWNGDPGELSKPAASDTDPAEDTIEIYEPPYLHRGVPRPVIQTAPATVGFGGSFGVGTLDENVKRAALIAPGAVTHGVDMNQRVLMLDVQQGDDCVSVTAPDSPEAAPPGYYMLFLLNDQGVPSIAKFVRVDEGGALGGCGVAPPPADVTAPVVDIQTPVGGTVAGVVDVRATASDARGVAGVRFQAQGLNVEDTTPYYATTWNTLSLANNTQYTITATARDAAGNTGTDSVTVTVQNVVAQPPNVRITSPAANSTVAGVVTLTAGGENLNRVKHVQFKVDGANIGGVDDTAPYSVQWGSIDVPNGLHTLTVVTTDTLNVERTSAGVAVNVQNVAGEPVDALPPKKPPFQAGPPGGQTPDDPSGPGNPGGQGNAAPGFSRLKMSPARVRKGKLTRIGFRLSEPAKVSVVFDRKVPGRRVRGRCSKPRGGARPNCTRYLRARTKLSFQGKTGANSIGFRGRGLAPGRYRLTLVAKDSTGKTSKAARLNFQLLASSRPAAARAALLSWF
jgi:hypothetical protein